MVTNFSSKGFKFDWIDVFNPTEEELRTLAIEHDLPEAAVIDCLQSEHLPKYEEFENYFFVIVRFYDKESKPGADTIQQLTRKVAIFYNKGFLLTVHRSRTPFIEELSDKYCNLKSVTHPFDIACMVVKKSLDTFRDPLRKIDQDIDLYESKIFLKKRIPDLLRSIYYIKRTISVFKKISIITRLTIEPIHASHKRNSFYEDMRDYQLQIETIIDELNDSVSNLLNLYLSLAAQKTNDVMRILTVFSAFFLPLTFIVGVYGMNFQYMPELNSNYGYPGVMVFMALITLLIFRWFKRKNWL